MAAHKHAEVIKAWADGAEIEWREGEGAWIRIANPAWRKDLEYRIKPAEPEREYVVTDLGEDELMGCIKGMTHLRDDIRDACNLALRQAQNSGQLVTRAEFDRAVGDRQKRDMAVAEAVQKEVQNQANARCLWVDGYRLYFNFSFDLRSVIDTVK